MALAKFYEDIIERLEDDRKHIVAKLRESDLPRLTSENPDLVRHIEKHMDASAKALNDMLEMFTDPNNSAPIFVEEAKEKVEEAKAKIKKIEQVNKSIKDELMVCRFKLEQITKERDSLKILSDTQQKEIRKMKEAEKNLKHQIKIGGFKKK